MIEGTTSQDEVIKSDVRSSKKKISIIIILIGVVGYFSFPVLSQWYFATPSIDLKRVKVNKVIRGDLIRDVVVSGKAVAANAPQLYSTEIGKITLLAKPGEAVQVDQVVAKLMSPELDALINQQQSTLEQLNINEERGVLTDKEAQLELESKMNAAQSSLNVAKREFQRAEISYGKQIISEVDWMKSQDTLADAKRLFDHSKKRVSLAKERLHFESKHR